MKRKMIRVAAYLMSILCLMVAVFYSFKIYDAKKQDVESEEVYASILDAAVKHGEPGNDPAPSVEEDQEESSTEASETAVPEAEPLPEDFPEIDMEYLKSLSGDVVGWLCCPDTQINYPLTQGSDNHYYLSHLADGSENRNGCLFIDCDNAADFSDENTIIYGHHMKSGAMFASLVNYGDQEYYEAHPYLYLESNGIPYRIDVFAGYEVSVDDDAYCRTFTDKHAFAEWMRQISSKSDFHTSMKLTTDDRIVTLSTCAYSFDNARYVLHGRLVRLDQPTTP